jgi:phosphatidylserine decarboxylase
MFRITRHGLREIALGTLLLLALAAGLAWWQPWAALVVLPVWLWLVAFFRDPERTIPDGPGVMVSPADGLVADIADVEEPLVGGPAVRVGIFLSIFNVHINRSPCAGTVTDIRFRPGRFLSALRHAQASAENQSNTLVLADASGRPVAVVRQIVGAIARRIVCDAQVGTTLLRGQRFGLIKFGSRTELTLPKSLNPRIEVRVGQKVRGGADIIAVVEG